MDYSVLPFAAIAEVYMYLRGPCNPSPEPFIQVDGDVEVNGFSILVKEPFKFSKNWNDFAIYNVKFSRTTVAVPVEWGLLFEVSLQHGGTDFVTGRIISNLTNRRNEEILDFKSKDENSTFVIELDYTFPDEFFGLLPKIDQTITEGTYVEVFSVVVGCDYHPVPSLHGIILFRDQDKTYYIFSREKHCPDNFSDRLHPSRSVLSLAWPDDRLVLAKDFLLFLYLMDLEYNYVCWGGFNLDNYPVQFGKRLCCLVPGEDGYFVAVHYSIFKDCRKAKVTFEWDGNFSLAAYGSVSAEYGNCHYGPYDDRYNRVIIFKRSMEDRVEVNQGSKIPLLKSLFATPLDCSDLYVYVDLAFPGLYVGYPDTTNKLRFEFGESDPNRDLWVYSLPDNQRVGRIKVNVNWSTLSEPEPTLIEPEPTLSERVPELTLYNKKALAQVW